MNKLGVRLWYFLLFSVILANYYNDCSDVGDIFILLHPGSSLSYSAMTLWLLLGLRSNPFKNTVVLRWFETLLWIFNHSVKSQLFLSQYSRRNLISFCDWIFFDLILEFRQFPKTIHQAMLKQLFRSVLVDNFFRIFSEFWFVQWQEIVHNHAISSFTDFCLFHQAKECSMGAGSFITSILTVAAASKYFSSTEFQNLIRNLNAKSLILTYSL